MKQIDSDNGERNHRELQDCKGKPEEFDKEKPQRICHPTIAVAQSL
jgi:hypothetical protein